MAAMTASNPDGSNLISSGTQWIYTNWQTLSVGFRPNSQGTVRIRLVKMDTADALYWDDAEVYDYPGACSKGTRLRYYPYGQEIGTVTANDTAKFGTYTRDSGPGLDYAMNRYYMSNWGRFTTADPYRASGGPGDPGSWNRYAYVQGDPVNQNDPSGLQASGPIYYCGPDPHYEGACVERIYIPYDPVGSGSVVTQPGDVQAKPVKPETKQECESQIKKEVEAAMRQWEKAASKRVADCMWKGAVSGFGVGTIFGLGPELPSGFTTGLGGAAVGAVTGAIWAMHVAEPVSFVYEYFYTNKLNAEARIERECGDAGATKR